MRGRFPFRHHLSGASAPGPLRAGGGVGLTLLVLAAGCGGGTVDAPEPASVAVDPAATLLTRAGEETTFRARVLDAGGSPLPGVPVTWSSSDPGVAVVDGEGTATAVGPGTTWIRATAGRVEGRASLEVRPLPDPAGFRPGVSATGRRRYTEYVPGTLPLVLAAPHGGGLTPAEIPDRTAGVTTADLNTGGLARAVRAAVLERTGAAPHLVLSHLHRRKLDPNRELPEAAGGNVFAEHAWREYHAFLDAARAAVEAEHGAGLLLDLHGHGHAVPRVELGYLLGAAELALDDATLDAPGYRDRSSIRALALSAPAPFPELLRGEASLGGLLEAGGVASVPAPAVPFPGSDPYLSGGYTTRRHGSRDGGTVSAIQLEHPYEGVRDTEAARSAYAGVLAGAVAAFLAEHYGAPPGRSPRPPPP